MVNNQVIIKKLENFGLTQRQANIYYSLLEKGVLSPLELSRITNVNRTTLYRELEELQKKGLVEEIIEEHAAKFSAVNPKALGYQIAKKETELSQLKNHFAELLEELSPELPHFPQPPNSSVRFYRGVDGLRQLLWNTLKAKKVVGYGYYDWNEGVGRSFAEKLRQEYVERQIINLELQNDEIENTNISQMSENNEYMDKYYELRLIPTTEIRIRHDTYIYNDIYAIYHRINNEPFGIEIQNAEIAKTQTQIFEFLWKHAKTCVTIKS